ncbi:hypothetical protein SAMD00019534_065360, partial [Acytostelium subglobosum LB1]|uniref:hypothetical protein n=1 Tax=Acytostelium subglobosum LB1 TaxID=1410327 RepID=UPI000644AC8B
MNSNQEDTGITNTSINTESQQLEQHQQTHVNIDKVVKNNNNHNDERECYCPFCVGCTGCVGNINQAERLRKKDAEMREQSRKFQELTQELIRLRNKETKIFIPCTIL